MTKLEWCRANAPEAFKDADDEFLLAMMSSSYDKFCIYKEVQVESATEELNEENNYLDKMVQRLINVFGDNLAFKGGYMLTKLMSEYARQTTDIDIGIQTSEIYQDVLETMRSIGDEFISLGYIERYTLTNAIQQHMSGGMDMYDTTGRKVLGIDVSWHDLSYGLTTTTISVGNVTAFTVERMLSDKIRAVLSRKRFRRVKDIYDIFCLTNCFDFDANKIIEFLNKGNPPEWNNFPFDESVIQEYEKAYNKLRLVSIVKRKELTKPSYSSVLSRFNTICYKLLDMDSECMWSHKDCTFL